MSRGERLMAEFSVDEAKILDLIQREFPLTGRPFDAIGAMVGCSGAEVMGIVDELKQRLVVRSISGIFNGESLGYHLCLVALKVPAGRIEQTAAIINSHPGVSHNYLRDHEFNLWFTLAEDGEASLQKSARVIAEKSGADDCLLLRNEKLLKIGFMLSIGEASSGTAGAVHAPCAPTGGLAPGDRGAVSLLQEDLPLTEQPFNVVAEKDSGWSGEALIEAGRRLLASGIMRRYAAVLRHAQAGFTHNAMTAWKIDCDDRFSGRVQPFIDEPAVTHLYLRTVYPGKWEYPLFAMVHARTPEELNDLLDSLMLRSGLRDRLVLRSLYEYKKKKVRYFGSAFEKWKRCNYD